MFNEGLKIPINRLPVIPSYIPLVKTSVSFSKNMQQIYSKIRSQVQYLIISTGYLERYYGYDLLIEAVKGLDLNIGLLFVFYTTSDEQYKNQLIPKINNNPNMWCLDNIKSDDMLSFIKKADVLVRANFADTYGMVIGDAIQLDTPAIASDICPRHSGAILFKTGNSDDLREKIISTLKILDYQTTITQNSNDENNAEKLLKMYKSIIKE